MKVPIYAYRKLAASYSGDKLTDNRAKAIVPYGGRLFVCTGARYSPGRPDPDMPDELTLLECVPAAQYQGETTDYKSAYFNRDKNREKSLCIGLLFTWRKREYVCVRARIQCLPGEKQGEQITLNFGE